jgi:hypothetical protein
VNYTRASSKFQCGTDERGHLCMACKNNIFSKSPLVFGSQSKEEDTLSYSSSESKRTQFSKSQTDAETSCYSHSNVAQQFLICYTTELVYTTELACTLQLRNHYEDTLYSSYTVYSRRGSFTSAYLWFVILITFYRFRSTVERQNFGPPYAKRPGGTRIPFANVNSS